MQYGSFLTIAFTTLATVLVTAFLPLADAQVMQSDNYQLQSDSVNIGGGRSTSTNYVQESTVGEVGTGPSESQTYALRAGYQQMQEVYIAVSGATTTTLSPSIGGVTGGESNGSTTVTVTTDSPSGYELTVESSEAPAMRSGADTLDDYAPAGDPDFSFTTGDGDAHFGFTPEGADIVLRYQDSGGVCNAAGGDTTLACWDGLSTTPTVISRNTSANHPAGATTTLHFRVGVGGQALPAPGSYIATTTVTALPL